METPSDVPLESDLAGKCRYGRILPALVDVTQDALARSGVESERAYTLAEKVVADIAFYCGGRPLYLPRGERLQAALRSSRIYKESGKTSVVELADRYGLTTSRVYQIIHEQRAMRRPLRARAEEGSSAL